MKNLNGWIQLLTGGRADKQQKFEEILASSKSEVLAIMKYRRLERLQGRGQDITLQDLLDCQIKDEGYLIYILQEMFLEKIELGQVEYFYKKAIEKYNDMNEAFRVLYDRHLEDKGMRFLTVVLTL